MTESLTFEIRCPDGPGPTTFLGKTNGKTIPYQDVLKSYLAPEGQIDPTSPTPFLITPDHRIELYPGLASYGWLMSQIERYILHPTTEQIPLLLTP